MYRFKLGIAAALAFCVGLSACEQADPTPQTAAAPPELERALGSIEYSREPGYSMDLLQRRVTEAAQSMHDVAYHANTWEEADALTLREIEEAEPGVIRRTVEQAVSKVVLVGYLVPNHADARASDVALAYTRRLVTRKSPEAEAVLSAVETFGPTWEPGERRAVALGAAEAVEAHVREGTSCQDCALPAEARRALSERGQAPDVVSLRRLDAARQLRDLAG